MAKKTCRRLSQRDQELLCEFVRKSSTCAACQEPEYVHNLIDGQTLDVLRFQFVSIQGFAIRGIKSSSGVE
ncbi:uncharacterized protein LOC128263567 [Drosophila gunungcola]|uniref:uncharacterized protein LOC128263567 n=1 Tax=Drosophila gunungcola TaxID=103775 RepID=UPI0022E0A370|nr:uncharacterized protein LOC128263567 [Drosophila gunungcola]